MVSIGLILCSNSPSVPGRETGSVDIQKKRESHLLFTLLEGFAIPVHSRKTTEIHGTFIVVATTVYEILRRFQEVANNVNKLLLLCHPI